MKALAKDVPLGFHGHNNLELALINTLTALEEGCEIVDATISGISRGAAGNVKTELLLTALNAQGKVEVDFNPLSKVVYAFSDNVPKNIIGLLPPYPRKMGTYIPNFIQENSFQLFRNRFVGSSSENITSVVLELCYLIEPQEVLIAGYDGYDGIVTNNQLELFNENEELFEQVKDLKIKSITPTKYRELLESSIYLQL